MYAADDPPWPAASHLRIAQPARGPARTERFWRPAWACRCRVRREAARPAGRPTLYCCGTGALPARFGGIRAPSTLGSFLRSFTWGNVRQLDAVARRVLARLASAAPGDEPPGAGGDLQRHLPRPQQRRGWTRGEAIS